MIQICKNKVTGNDTILKGLFDVLAKGPPGYDDGQLSRQSQITNIPQECLECRNENRENYLSSRTRTAIQSQRNDKAQIRQFYSDLQNKDALFHYLPLHGAHPLDWEHEFEFMELPQNLYVIGLPFNCEGLFFSSKEENAAFFELLKQPGFYNDIKMNRTNNEMKEQLYNHLRVWLPGNVILNRALQVESTVAPSVPKALYKNEMNSNMVDLYSSLIRDENGMRGGRGLTRRRRKTKRKKQSKKKKKNRRNKYKNK